MSQSGFWKEPSDELRVQGVVKVAQISDILLSGRTSDRPPLLMISFDHTVPIEDAMQMMADLRPDDAFFQSPAQQIRVIELEMADNAMLLGLPYLSLYCESGKSAMCSRMTRRANMPKSLSDGLNELRSEAVEEIQSPEPEEALSLEEGLERMTRGQHPFTAQSGDLDLSWFMRPIRR